MKLIWIPTGIMFAMCGTLFLSSCSKNSGSDYGSGSNGGNNNPPPTSANTITISNMRYSVGSLTVKSGTTVTWVNDDDMAHTVTADDNSFTSASLKKGDSYKHTFSNTGSYPYHCTFHPTMKASIVVDY